MTQLSVKLLAAGLFAIAIIAYSILVYDGEARFYRIWYYTPSAIAAGPFFVDRF